jgi:hypothetical protein
VQVIVWSIHWCAVAMQLGVQVQFCNKKANDVLNFTRIISFFCDVGEEFPSPHTSNFTNFGGGFI